MCKKDRNRQYCITDFDQPMGMKLDPENRWVKKSENIPWNDIEDRYAELFPSNTGMPAKPLRMALGSLLIQKKLGFSDRDLVAEITENPYLQYFIGLPAYQNKAPFAPSLLVEFGKRLTEEILGEINEMIIDFNIEKAALDDTDDGNSNGYDSGNDKADNAEVEEKSNEGILIIDATCAPQNISYPQDINLLNEARENLEGMIDQICYEYGLEKPRTYRKNARRDYLSLAKCKKRTKKRIEKAIRQQLQYVRRDLKYAKAYLAKRNYGLGLLKTKLDTTTRSSIALSIIAMNVERLNRDFLHLFSKQIIWRTKQCILVLLDKNSKPLREFVAC